jgi:hypothetical protein
MAVREAILSVTGGSLTIIVVVVGIAMLVRKAGIIVAVRVCVMHIVVMSIAVLVLVVVLVLVLVEAMAERVMLDTMMMCAEGVVKRHVHGWQDLEASEPEQASKHGADPDQSRSSTAIHCSGTVAIFLWPINTGDRPARQRTSDRDTRQGLGLLASTGSLGSVVTLCGSVVAEAETKRALEPVRLSPSGFGLVRGIMHSVESRRPSGCVPTRSLSCMRVTIENPAFSRDPVVA